MRHRHLSFAAAVGLALVAGAASVRAEDLPTGYGVVAPSGSSFTTTVSPGGDADDYAFPAFPGTKVTVVVKPSKVVAPDVQFIPALEIIRPDGAPADDDSGFLVAVKGTTHTASMTLDAAGWWKVRVRGKNLAAPSVPPAPVNPPIYSSGSYSISIVYKSSPTLPLRPQLSKSFTTKNAVIATKSDTDDFTFEAYPGQTIAAKVTKPKSSTLLPGLSLFRPDGTVVTGGVAWNQKFASVSTTVGAGEQGTWRVRVYGELSDPPAPANTTGAYTLSVKLGKPTSPPSLKPDVNGQFRFAIPAAGGATITYALSFKGDQTDPPLFNSFTGPTGVPVPGFNGALKLTNYRVPDAQPIGLFLLTFDAPASPMTNVSFTSRVTPALLGKPKKLALAPVEPIIYSIDGVTPSTGGSASITTITVRTNGNLVDPSVDDPSKVAVFLDHLLLTGTTVLGSTVRADVPKNMPIGLHDIVVQTSSGQVAVAKDAFEVVPPPKALSIDPSVGSVAGGYPVTITGEGFSKLGDPQIVIDLPFPSSIVPVQIVSVSDTEFKFIAPNYGAPGKKTFGVIDARNANVGMLPLESFEFVSSPAINRLVPNLTTILGGDIISVTGANFQPTDHVYLERTPTSGGIDAQGNLFGYDEMTNTYVDASRHQFTAPPKAKGEYEVFVYDQFFQPKPPRTRKLTYFQFSDLSTATTGMFPSGGDVWDGNTVAVADFDKDGRDDLFLSRIGGATIGASSATRVLRNDTGAPGHFTDVTESVMPSITAAEDWRANRIWASDVNKDTYPDIVIVTNDSTILSPNSSHVRILINEQKAAGTPNDRWFRDRTSSLMPSVRMSNPLYSGSAGVADNWRGLDMWVGDVDKGPAGPPEILITHKEMKAELDVSCVPLCSSPFSSGYTYGFYWGGSRAFFWDKNANGGLGKYKFAHNFFPRKSGLRVPIVAPGGVTIPICNAQYGQPCVDRFTPFIGKRITAGDLNGDAKPDVAVLSDGLVQRIFPPSTAMVTISSLQVGINKFNTVDGAEITDATAQLTAIGGDFRGDAVEIAGVGYPDGNSLGTVVVAKAAPAGAGIAMRLLKFKPGALPNPVFDFEDITTQSLPATSASDVWQASRILFKDVDTDGDQDMILVCPTPPGGSGPAFRVLRNDIVNLKAGIFTMTLMPLVQDPYMPLSAGEHFEADAMEIGDLNKDGAFDFVLVRADPTAQAPQTRIVIIDKGDDN